LAGKKTFDSMNELAYCDADCFIAWCSETRLGTCYIKHFTAVIVAVS
jgi:hypothetical protein